MGRCRSQRNEHELRITQEPGSTLNVLSVDRKIA
jgi:hypothetical protein